MVSLWIREFRETIPILIIHIGVGGNVFLNIVVVEVGICFVVVNTSGVGCTPD